MERYEVVPALRDAIENRRKALGLSPGDLAEKAHVTPQGLMPLRKGHRKQYQSRLTGSVCAALGWSYDSIDRILGGGEPLVVDVPAPDQLDEIRHQLARLEGRVRALEFQALQDGLDGTVSEFTGLRAAHDARYPKGEDGPPEDQDGAP